MPGAHVWVMRPFLALLMFATFSSLGCLGTADTFQAINPNRDGGRSDGSANGGDNGGGNSSPDAGTTTSPDLSSGGGQPGATDAVSYNLQVINDWRAQYGLAPVQIHAPLHQYAYEGSDELSKACPSYSCSSYHQHYEKTLAEGTEVQAGFCNGAGENQGVGAVSTSQASIQKMIKTIVDNMMTNDASWNWAHRDVIINPHYRNVGIGLVFKNNKMYLTNDFTGPCN